jgi:uncharacterized protein (DUF2062 family)
MIEAAVGAVLIGFACGVVVGYFWQDRISRARRARYSAKKARRVTRELGGKVVALTPRDDLF